MKTWLWVMLMTSTAVLAMSLVWIFSASPSSGSPLAAQRETVFDLPGKGEPWPKVVLETTEYDFGTMDVQQEHEHAFVVRNEGDAPLKLKVGQTTCKCTIGRLLRDEIAPGKSAKIHLQWKTLGTTDNFRQTAEILTNDPDRPRFGLILTGKIRTYLGIIPKQLVFDDASAHASATRTTSIYSQAMEQFEVTKVDSTSKYLSYEVTPLTQQSLESQRFMSGYQFAVTVEPGIPIGRFFERMTIHTDIKDVKPVELTIKGTMSGDVSIYGSSWNNEASYANFGSVPRDVGASCELHLYGHGPYRDLQPEDFTIRTEPDFLKVHLTRDAELTGPKAPAHLILKIEVPADSPPVNYVGSKTNPLGEVMLKPNLPEDSGAVPINLGVKFNVQQ